MHNPTTTKTIEKALTDLQRAQEQLEKLKQQKRFVDAIEKLAVAEAVLDGLKRAFPAEFEAVVNPDVNPESDETEAETASEEAANEADSTLESDETDHSNPSPHVDSNQNW